MVIYFVGQGLLRLCRICCAHGFSGSWFEVRPVGARRLAAVVRALLLRSEEGALRIHCPLFLLKMTSCFALIPDVVFIIVVEDEPCYHVCIEARGS
jgi:hypothetical protein